MKFFATLLAVFVVCKGETTNEPLGDNGNEIKLDINGNGNEKNCTTNLLHLKTNQTDLDVEVTWDVAPMIENCSYDYIIHLTEISANRTSVSMTEKVEETRFKTKIQPCTQYSITVELFERNDDRPLGNLSETLNTEIKGIFIHLIDACGVPVYRKVSLKDFSIQLWLRVCFNVAVITLSVLEPVLNLEIMPFINSLRLAWKPSVYSRICKIHYIINAISTSSKKAIPYFRREIRAQHWMRNLSPCTRYSVSVIPTSMYHHESDEDNNGHLVYEIDTLPRKASDLQIAVHDSDTEISWLPPINQDCIEQYKITVEDLEYVTDETRLTINESLYCKEIKVQAITSDGNSGEPLVRLKPGPVRNISIQLTDASANVFWQPPSADKCIKNYFVQLMNTKEGANTTENKYAFNGLSSCTNYMVSVATRADEDILGDPISFFVKTTEPTDIGRIENFDMTVVNNIAILSWDKPKNTEACDVTYTIRVYDNDDNELFKEETNNTINYMDFTSLVGCMLYVVTVQPVVGPTTGSEYKSPMLMAKEMGAPKCKTREIEETAVVLECDIDSYEENMCSVYELTAKCEGSVTERNANWIVTNVTSTHSVSDDRGRSSSIQMSVVDISEFTNYTCFVVVENSAGKSPKSKSIEFQTKEDVPGPPIITEIADITNTSCTVKWAEPEKVPGVLIMYRITIERQMPLHFIPDPCQNNENPLDVYEIDEPSIHEFPISNLSPSYRYIVSVTAETQVGCGNPGEQQVETKAGMPEEPFNVDFDVIKTDIFDYNVSVNVTWTYPCTNGVIKHFEVDVFGHPLIDLATEAQNYTKRVLINEPINNLNYECVIEDLEPAFNYTLAIKTIAEDDQESSSVNLVFQSPESLSEPPILKEIANITKSSFTMEWDEPPRKNGRLTNYFVHIINEGPSYWMPDDCNNTNKNYVYILPTNITSFRFKEGQPSYKYVVKIGASTPVGNGSLSSTRTIKTSDSEPEPVRNYKVQIVNGKTENYNVSMIMTFNHPCRTNGILKQFGMILYGHRHDNLPHTVEYSFSKSLKRNEYRFVTSLFAEYNYVLTVQAETASYKTNSILNFQSPSGAPPAVTTDVVAPLPISSMQAEYNLSKSLFDAKYGDILYYALILGRIDYSEEAIYGFWEGTNQTWPHFENRLDENGIGIVQVTPPLWNPFKRSFEDIVRIVIGDGNHSIHNRPLQPQATYTFKVRGFTRYGYRDTSLVTFELPEESLSSALIFGVTFGILLTGIVLGFVIVLLRKTQQCISCSAEKKELIKSIPLTPIPVSVKRFPRHYHEMRENADKLKQEYALLTSKSGEIILTTFDGLLPENKKKNRYTNIIPYDQTRVKLIDTNDNVTITDYINASYVQGISGNIEYIATQGPLQHTCLDFWKIVIQENSSLIVMVAQFVEQNKDKCYRYFPNNHENMELENGIAIRCCTELNFKTYTVRTLLVQKDLQQWTVTHLQFTDWPDFGCPVGTQVMLEFCQLMREHAERNPDPIIIHCSAGVGRTGTLIALDILLQAIQRKRDIDIFGTVLNLRRDRKNMVQTEKQYFYIHSCIYDAIENPLPVRNGDLPEPIYENLEDIKNRQNGNNIVESQF